MCSSDLDHLASFFYLFKYHGKRSGHGLSLLFRLLGAGGALRHVLDHVRPHLLLMLPIFYCRRGSDLTLLGRRRHRKVLLLCSKTHLLFLCIQLDALLLKLHLLLRDLEVTLTLESLAKVAILTHSDDDINENPERLIFRYTIPNDL